MRSWRGLLSTTILTCALLATPMLRAQTDPEEMFPAPPVVSAPIEAPPAASQPAPALPAAPAPAPVESEGAGFPWGTAIGGGVACTACTAVSGGLSGLGIYFLIESLNRASQLDNGFGACCMSVIGVVGMLVTNAVAVVLAGGLGPVSVAGGALIGSLVGGQPPWWGLLGAIPGAGVGLIGMGLAVASLTVLEEPLASMRSSPDAVDPRYAVLATGIALSLLSPALTLVGAVGATWLASPAPAEATAAPVASPPPPAPAAAPAPPPEAPRSDEPAPTAAPLEPPPAAPPSPAQDVVDY